MGYQKARVHSFESFGTVDGPGVRFVIFFQGCHLSCLYCHNRDLWESDGGKEYSVAELFAEVKKYQPYFKSSGGGVTVSGGDPILQAKAVTSLFRKCRAAGIHTALDTSGAVPLTPDVEELLSVTDLVLLDIKQIRDESHRSLTGISNRCTLAFAKYLSDKKIPTWIRYVVVPGLTDSDSDCKALADFIATLTNVEKVELLAFHKMGEFKWESLNETYALHDTSIPSTDIMERVKLQFAQLSIPVCSAER